MAEEGDEFVPSKAIDIWVVVTVGEDETILSREMNEEVVSGETAAAEPYEAELVGRAKARSPEAWTEIYNTHYRPIFRYVKARVFDETIAEDLTSAVFVGALKGIDSYRYRGRPLLAWLYRIARNVVAGHQRKFLRSRGRGLKQGLDLPRQVIWHLIRRSRPGDEARAADPVSVASSEGDPATILVDYSKGLPHAFSLADQQLIEPFCIPHCSVPFFLRRHVLDHVHAQ